MSRVWVVIAFIIALFPAAMFLLQDGYFASSDGMIHLYRLFELDRALHAGILYPRWFPLSGYGYGLPVLDYYPPLAYYLAELFHIVGAGYIVSIKLLVALGFFVAAIPMFLFARELLGDRAAFVAGVSYAYLPYLLSDAYVRGNFPEFLAMSLLPLALLAFRRAYDSREWLSIIGAAVMFATIVCTHHLTAMLFAVLLLGYLGLLFISRRDVRGLIRCGAALMLALVLSAFYWLPALAELNLTYVGPASVARFIVSRLVSMTDFFAPSLAYTYLPQSDALTHAPGFPQTVVALLVGIISMIVILSEAKNLARRRETLRFAQGDKIRFTFYSLFFFLVVALSLAMTLTISSPLWYAISPLRFLQFPWRFQILAGVGMAFLIGVCAKWIIDSNDKWSMLVAPTFSAALILLGAWNVPLRAFPLDDAQVDLTRSSDSDYVIAQMGWGWTREFVPAGVTDSESIYAPIAKPSIPSINPSHSPPTVKILGDGLLAHTFQVSTRIPFELSLHTFYFPGWQAYIDDVAVSTYARGGLGLATVAVPSGDHSILFQFEDTPLHVIVDIVSLISFVVIIAGLFIVRRRIAIVLIVALIFIAAMLMWHTRADARTIQPVTVSANVNGQVMLIGYSTDRTSDALQVTLYWLALQEMNQDYTGFVHVIDANGDIVAQHDGAPDQGLTPTTRWLPGEIITDRHNIALPFISSGDYRLTAGMYVAKENGFESLGNEVELGHEQIR